MIARGAEQGNHFLHDRLVFITAIQVSPGVETLLLACVPYLRATEIHPIVRSQLIMGVFVS